MARSQKIKWYTLPEYPGIEFGIFPVPIKESHHKPKNSLGDVAQMEVIRLYLNGVKTERILKYFNISPGYLYAILPNHKIMVNRKFGQKELMAELAKIRESYGEELKP
jgi:hypothetical protein